jgi:hypothetical protein
MKSTIILAIAIAASSFAGPPKADLAQVHKVYLLPMRNGIDQYLANRLTNLGVFQVVTDPKKADAVFTDQLGESFERRLGEWFPDAPLAGRQPVAPASEAAPAKPTAPAATAEKSEKAAPPAQTTPPAKPEAAEPAPAETPTKDQALVRDLKGDTTTRLSSFGRARGTLFLVDPHSRLVLWSIYSEPKSSSAVELDRTAERIATMLKQDMKSR